MKLAMDCAGIYSPTFLAHVNKENLLPEKEINELVDIEELFKETEHSSPISNTGSTCILSRIVIGANNLLIKAKTKDVSLENRNLGTLLWIRVSNISFNYSTKKTTSLV